MAQQSMPSVTPVEHEVVISMGMAKKLFKDLPYNSWAIVVATPTGRAVVAREVIDGVGLATTRTEIIHGHPVRNFSLFCPPEAVQRVFSTLQQRQDN